MVKYLKNITDLPEFILRIGLWLVILWFWIDHIVNFAKWSLWVPFWAVKGILTVSFYTKLFWVADIILWSLLLLNIKVKYVAWLLALQMLFIVLVVTWYNDIMVRDFGLFIGFLALYFMKK